MSHYYSSIKFSEKNNRFSHNLEADYTCFALWKSARPYRDKIRALLSAKFEILLETEIVWSKENFHDNAARLYENPLYDSIPKEKRKSQFADKLGDEKFNLFVIKDIKPDYAYVISTSKIIELSNLNTVHVKAEIRKWIFNDLGVEYAVHSTNGIYEFFFQAPLLLGVELFNTLMDGETPTIPRITKDLEGANGWSNWEELFKILNLTNNYLVLKNHEGFPHENSYNHLELLTDNYQRVASALAINQLSSDGSKGFIKVGGTNIPVDIRFIGDKYHNTSWQKDMLNKKVNKNGYFELRTDMYFFSLLYSCKVQKSTVTDKDIEILDKLAKDLKFTWYEKEMLHSDDAIGEILKGYFKAHQYHYEDPIDKQLSQKRQIIRHLPNENSIIVRESKKTKLKRKIKDVIPESMFPLLKNIYNKVR
ncbi:hypothetical protein [Pedobacter nyackensis]|uniref:hypothetical protein n=1 Tax=Pedobacter nyackensis TaxID=475255 RepID=UPI00292E16CD|nr:hypothetical protein [Pedobacter nyackensis]